MSDDPNLHEKTGKIVKMENLRTELRDYYSRHTYEILRETECLQPLFEKFGAYVEAHSEMSALQLKAAQYELIAEEFQPVIFRNSPFYAEMGVKAAEYDGVGAAGIGAGVMLSALRAHIIREHAPEECFQCGMSSEHAIHLFFGPYADYDHHCFAFSNVVRNGLEYYYRRAESLPDDDDFAVAVKRGLLAVRKIAEKFAAAAVLRLQVAEDETERRFLTMIAGTAGRIPWKKPETFFEGLQTMWFLHEVCASIEGVGMSVLGRPDYLLGDLYERDLAAGRITRDEARDLVARFLLGTDCKIDNTRMVDESFNRQEQGDTLILGGCDREGNEVCNEVTMMILEVHSQLKLIYPKIHCRVSRGSAREFLDALNREFLRGRNVISLLNDDGIIPAQVRCGKNLEDVRNYVAGGCWETIVESCEHSAGANCYVNLARIMDLSIHDSAEVTAETGHRFQKIDRCGSFDEVYRTVMDNAIRVVRRLCTLIGKNGRLWPQVNPAPLFSACLNDCLEKGRDYTEGGGRYNPHGVPLSGFAVFVDSLLAVRHLCFEEKLCSLDELLRAVRNDWKGGEIWRAEIIRSAPHWGDDQTPSNELAAQIIREFHAALEGLTNERGGPYQLGIYNYRDIIDWAALTRATPDGRRRGDFLTQGLTPSRLRSGDITGVINSCSRLDLSLCPANSIITVSLDKNGADLNSLAAFEKVWMASGVGMLQLNCVGKEELEDARLHPERHLDLVVRLYGYSARFACLSPEMQDEFVRRTIYRSGV